MFVIMYCRECNTKCKKGEYKFIKKYCSKTIRKYKYYCLKCWKTKS